MQRVVIVYNKRSSKAGLVEEEVIAPARKKGGLMVGKYGVLKTGVQDNAERLAKILLDGDIVVAAGGDGTATIALNGAMLSGKRIKMAALPYGNFNDMARAFLGNEGKTWYPLEIRVNGKHFCYAGGYFSVGMFAKSTEIFDENERRKKLQQKQGGLVFSIKSLAKWYFGGGKKEHLVGGIRLNGKELGEGMTDYMAVNCGTVARIMKAGEYGFSKVRFYRSLGSLGNTGKLLVYMMRSMKRIPGDETTMDVLEFPDKTKLEIQVEGEHQKLRDVKKIEIGKAETGVKVIKKVW